jgi:hypothetical protein
VWPVMYGLLPHTLHFHVFRWYSSGSEYVDGLDAVLISMSLHPLTCMECEIHSTNFLWRNYSFLGTA